jgi:hypothetical protein
MRQDAGYNGSGRAGEAGAGAEGIGDVLMMGAIVD